MIGAGLMIIAVMVAGEDMTVVTTEVAEVFAVTIVATGMTADGVGIGGFEAVIEPVIIRLLPLKF